MRTLSLEISPRPALRRIADALRVTLRPDTPARARDTALRTGRLEVPVIARTREMAEITRHFEQGRHMARQEEWGALGALIRACDRRRAQSAGGLPVAEILASGARSDVVDAGIAAARRGDADGSLKPLGELEQVLEELCCDHGVALVVALAHVDIGHAWRGEAAWAKVPSTNRAAFHAHFRAARRIVDAHDPFECDAPSLAAVRCALLAADRRPAARVADDYEDLVDLDPTTPRHMRALGTHLLPRWFGSYGALDLEARRTAARTADIWGAGAYAWVYLDALAVDPGASALVDPEFLVAGLYDILERRPEQHVVNMLAAFTGFTLCSGPDAHPAERRVAGAFDWILRDRLLEVHPMVWAAAHARVGTPTEGCAAERGKARALSTLAQHFAAELGNGQDVALTPSGWQIGGR
ncbi:hypothetical protein [Roseivivax isoporae]|uniref:Uncharacterized protein n=1 Tax=Roseivivax isoporae LMG 25204 TaxID=1449351 RepID=X7F8K0_9RHOB|nr:hypothetical protein [Roseivivax isoporae]ETX29237.1 hypothetical protein RISW2_02180 [Roseivivax isoporae LMG 25204]